MRLWANVGDLAVLVHGGLAQQGVGVGLAQPAALDQDGLGLVDDLAVFERAPRFFELAGEPREGVEARNRHVQYGLNPLFAQPIHHISRHAGLYRSLDFGGVRPVDEHGDGLFERPRQREIVLEPVAIGVLEVDHDHVGRDLGDPPGRLVIGIEHADLGVTRLAQAILDDLRAQAIFIDDEDREVAAGHARSINVPIQSAIAQIAHLLCIVLPRAAGRVLQPSPFPRCRECH